MNNEESRRLLVPYKAKVVEPIYLLSEEQRKLEVEKCGLDVMKLDAEHVFLDFVTDTGTGALSCQQFSQTIMADESYVRSASFKRLQSVVQEIFGFPYVTIVHQGRGGQNIFDRVVLKPGMAVPGNTHFPAYESLIKDKGGQPVDCIVSWSPDENFNGNIDLKMLGKVIEEFSSEKVAYVLITATCNVRGGIPVSMENIRKVKELAKSKGILVCIDGARFAENAYAIKRMEAGYSEKSVREIVKEMFLHADACIISAKKDGIAPTGGFICVRDKVIHEKLIPLQYMMEGYQTNGGLSGSTMDAIAFGLKEVTDDIYCRHRYKQIVRFGKMLQAGGISMIEPFGCHGVVIDSAKCFSKIPRSQYPATFLSVEVYKEGGVRVLPFRNDNPKTPELNRDWCFLCVPRRLFSLEHFEYAADVIITAVRRNKETSRGLRIVDETKKTFAYAE